MYRHSGPPALPIPPQDLLERFLVHEPVDTRFQSCARLLQSIWRQRRGFEAGQYSRPSGETLTLGSRLDAATGRAGFNYLRPDIARLVRRELAFRERGALIDQGRVWENLLASSAMVYNIFGPLKLDLTATRRVLNAVLPAGIKTVTGFYFESSPGRGDPGYIADHTAFDVVVTYIGKDGANCFLGIEVKYAESSPATATPVKPRLLEVAEFSGMYIDAQAALLQRPPLRQFYAEHSLCYAMVYERRDFDRGRFVLIAPTMNYEMATAIQSYRSHLAPSASEPVPFDVVSLERLVAAVAVSGQTELARSLERRADFVNRGFR